MKLIIFAVTILFGVVNLIKSEELPTGCDANNPENPKHLPHPERCDAFYTCENGEPILFNCPEEEHWNIEKNVCDWIEDAKCVRPIPPVDPVTTPKPVVTPAPELPKGCDANNPENPKHLPHPERCDAFYTCENGEPILFNCPEEEHWNIEKNVCDWIEDAKCVRPIPPVDPETTTKPAETPKPEVTPAPELPKGCDPNEDPDHPTHLPHPDRCDVFYVCDKGVPVLLECPEGEHWNIEKDLCDYPEEANCVRPIPPVDPETTTKSEETPKPETTPAPELPKGCDPNEDPDHPTHLPHPDRCDVFYVCDKGVPVLLECPEGEHWNIEKDLCDYPEEANCVRPIPLKSFMEVVTKPSVFTIPRNCINNSEDPSHPTHLPHETRCDAFFICENGEPVLFDCPDGEHWNIEKNICDFPEDAQCVRPLPPVEPEVTPKPDLPTGCNNPNEDPSHPTHLPHQTRCDAFYTCENGEPILFECPAEEHWNIEKNICDWIADAKCVRPLPPVDPKPELPKGCDANNPENPTHLPHPERCDAFFVCENGTPILLECTEGEHWNIEKNVCDWIDDAKCVRPLP